MISVRFVRAYRMYQPGEVAGFDDTLANRLIKNGDAVDAKAATAAKKRAQREAEKAKAEADAAAKAEAEKAKAEADAAAKKG